MWWWRSCEVERGTGIGEQGMKLSRNLFFANELGTARPPNPTPTSLHSLFPIPRYLFS